MKILFCIKQYIKMFVQNVYLPSVYKRACKKDIDEKKIIFADAHSNGVNSSMKAIYKRLCREGYNVKDMCVDFGDMSMLEINKYMKRFMKEYADSHYIFISSYFLPVSACAKRSETKVIQLWHSGGLMKKMGYDAKDDIPKIYKGKVTKNYDLVTVSSDICIDAWSSGLGIEKAKIKATGLARTDIYYNKKYNEKCIEKFFKAYPEAKGKKICVYAPSFSGNAANPQCVGINSGIFDVFEKLKDEWFFVVKLHPHLLKKYPEYDSELKTEECFSVCDVLITDYSSVLFDYLTYRKPFLLFAPDLEKYEKERGFYVDYRSFPAKVATTKDELLSIFLKNEWKTDREELDKCFKLYMGMCDGKAIERIIKAAEIK